MTDNIICRTEHFAVHSIKEQFEKSIIDNDVTIAVMPTSSGKTQAFPYFALNALMAPNSDYMGHCYVIVPRVVVAIKSASYNNTLWNTDYPVAGYMTGRGGDSTITDDTLVRYITEGSFLSRGIIDTLDSSTDIALVDEAHEQNIKSEAIMYKLAMKSLVDGQKIGVLSATIDPTPYLLYFQQFGLNVGVIELPELPRKYETNTIITKTPLSKIAEDAGNGKRCLVGCSGKRDIDEAKKYIRAFTNGNVKIYEYHGDLEEEEETVARGAMVNPQEPCVFLSTNILQSSVTIEDLDSGYFMGYGKRMESMESQGVLTEYLLTKAEMGQWIGRGGRTKDFTVYITPEQKREDKDRGEYPPPAIQLEPTENTLLDLLGIGIDITDGATLLNMPDQADTERAMARLEYLGIVKEGKLTERGYACYRLPFDLEQAIAVQACIEKGLPNMGHKLGLVMDTKAYNKARLRKYRKFYTGWDHTTYGIWIKVTEMFLDEYGVINSQNGSAFKAEADPAGIFRREAKKLISDFHDIDMEYSDINCSDEYKRQVMDLALRDAFKGNIYTPAFTRRDNLGPFREVSESHSSIAKRGNGFSDNVCGDLFVYKGIKALNANWLMDDNPLYHRNIELGEPKLRKYFGIGKNLLTPVPTNRLGYEWGSVPFSVDKDKEPDSKCIEVLSEGWEFLSGDLPRVHTRLEIRYVPKRGFYHQVLIESDYGFCGEDLMALRRIAVKYALAEGANFSIFDIFKDNKYLLICQ